MNRKLNKEQKGFTIIEVLIVLAIAGLIMLIVFLAVPALQRNSRNTQRRADISSVLGAFQEYSNNNNGQLPPTPAVGVTNSKLGFYAPGDFTGSTANAAAQTTVTPNETGAVVNNFAKCPAAQPAPGTIAALAMGTNPTRRNVAVVYRIETSSDAQTQCQDL